jgi:hypothetical protein
MPAHQKKPASLTEDGQFLSCTSGGRTDFSHNQRGKIKIKLLAPVRHLTIHEFPIIISSPIHRKAKILDRKVKNPDQQKIIALKFYLCY